MVNFLWEICKRAWSEWFSSMGTTALAVFFGFGQPLWKLGSESFHGKTLREGLSAMTGGFVKALRNGAAITLLLWFSLFLMHMIFTVPKHIRSDADNLRAYVRIPSLPVPSEWKEEYERRKEHQRQEAIAATQGFITFDREQQIEEVLSKSSKKCQITYASVANIDPKKIEPIKRAAENAGWHTGGDFNLGVIINYVSPFQDRLYVSVPAGMTDCGSVLCQALSVPCHPPQPSSGISFRGITVVITRQ